jgi:hypothetical protein
MGMGFLGDDNASDGSKKKESSIITKSSKTGLQSDIRPGAIVGETNWCIKRCPETVSEGIPLHDENEQTKSKVCKETRVGRQIKLSSHERRLFAETILLPSRPKKSKGNIKIRFVRKHREHEMHKVLCPLPVPEERDGVHGKRNAFDLARRQSFINTSPDSSHSTGIKKI